MIKIFTTTIFMLLTMALSAQGYQALGDFSPGSTFSDAFRVHGESNGKAIFSIYNDTDNRQEFWISNGTEAGTTLLMSYDAEFPNGFFPYAQGNNEVYIAANNQIHKFNNAHSVIANDVYAYRINLFENELYFLDQTQSFVTCLGKVSSNPDAPECIIEIGDALMTDITNYNGEMILIGEVGSSPHLFQSDGTASGTIPFYDFVKEANGNKDVHFMENNGLLYFFHEEDFSFGNIEKGLYVTDGTEAGTEKLAETHPGNFFDFAEPLTVFNDDILYMAGPSPDNEFAVELWKSDGTAAGTQFVKDMNGTTMSSEPKNFVTLNGVTYFTAKDTDNKRKIWQTNGTEAGTFVILDNMFLNDYGDWLTVYDGKLAFGGYNPAEGSELWFSDGTEAGTIAATDETIAGDQSYSPKGLFAIGNQLYYTAFVEGVGREVWAYSNGMVATNEIDNDFYRIQTSPNPFAESTIFSFENLDNVKAYQLQIMDASGKMMEQVAVPATGQMEWRGNNFPKGILFYHLMEKGTGNVVTSGRILKM